ncbi:MAG TPA: dihydropteroate synthase [Thermoanaerobaculia bacterium]|nr:dihydropteroate synthase [Thermoanaerobaculia bacterium]
MAVRADLVFPAATPELLREIASWDGVRLATFAASEFPVDVVRLERSSSPPIVLSRGKRAESLKALPAGLRERVLEAFSRAEGGRPLLSLARGKELDLSRPPIVMGVVNVTPDSFSDGGVYFDRDRAVDRALEMFEAGAAIVDIGGESTRPANYGEAVTVPVEEEILRVVPVIEGIRRSTDRPISVDTRKAAVARRALAAGADLVNDVSALRYDPEMAATVAGGSAGLLLMHMKGSDPSTMQTDTTYDHPIADVAAELAAAASKALEAGIGAGQIAVDPGLGFGKSPEGNLLLLRHLRAFSSLGFPVAIGASRKGFVRRFSGVAEDSPAEDRLSGSLAALAAARAGGASIVRVHDVVESVRYLRMIEAIETPAVRYPAEAAAR